MTPLSSAATAIANMMNNPRIGAEIAPEMLPTRERRHAGEWILNGDARMYSSMSGNTIIEAVTK